MSEDSIGQALGIMFESKETRSVEIKMINLIMISKVCLDEKCHWLQATNGHRQDIWKEWECTFLDIFGSTYETSGTKVLAALG